MKAWQLSCALLASIVLPATINADDVRANFVGSNSCASELKLAATRYGIRLDSSQNAYLMAYRLKSANILAILQYEKNDQACGIIRDVAQSRDHDSSFIWECRSPRMRSDVVVGTWPAKHPSVTGPAVEAWRINLKALKFEPVRVPVNCEAGNYRGNDEKESLADWARERAARNPAKSPH